MNIKNVIPLQIKCYYRYLCSKNNWWKDFEKNIDERKKKIVVTLAADYGNLGDVAITLAQEEFLRKHFPEYQIIDFPIAMTYTHMKSLKAIVNEEDIITIVGGGNMGDLYPDIEACRQFIIRSFPKNRIISFPQTIYFEKKRNLRKCVRVYSKHRQLTMAARECYSYEFMKEYFRKANIILAPDIVLSFKSEVEVHKEGKVLLIIRDDKEAVLHQQEKKCFIESICKQYDADISDTVFKTQRMSVAERKERLASMLSKIRSSSVVVTNRLHGMIFCVITNTPCVVLPIKGDKIKGVFKWIDKLDFIKYCSSYNIDELQKQINAVRHPVFDTLNLDDEFEVLLKSMQ